MPRNLVPCVVVAVAVAVAVAACGFDADYAGGHFTCSDGACPSGLACVANHCIASTIDAAHADASPDARQAALTCVDPGVLAVGGGTISGSTSSRGDLMSATCNALVMNGPDAVYAVDATIGQHLLVTIDGSYPVRAYVLTPCLPAPQTPTCIGNTYASMGNPASITAAVTGHQYVVVDGENAGLSGTYTLTVAVSN